LKTYSHYTLRIEGHTDSRGAAKANLSLSTKRAKTCYMYLKNKGIDAKRMTYRGYGENKPIRTNNTEAGRSRNRRVEFILK
ncbi:MAG: OmpA family protein, partial [Saprospiraceae bacterium]